MPLVTLDELVSAAEQAEISSMGTIVNRIVEVIKSPKSNAMELKALIELDPALSAIILRRANSAYYGMKRTLTNILDAIVCLGFDTVKELALSQKVSQMFRKEEVIHGYSRKNLWVHTLAVALTGKLIYRREYRMRGDDIYTAGILHDLGILIMDQFLRQNYHPVLEQVEKNKQNLRDAEVMILGFSHEELGLRLMKAWNLPEDFCRVIRYAEQPELACGDDIRLAKTLFVSNIACQNRSLGYIENPQYNRNTYQECLTELNLTEAAIKVIMDEARQEIVKMQEEGWFK